MSAETPNRYHPVHVALHWAIALFVISFLALGSFVMSPLPNDQELSLLGMHSMLGPILAILILVRLATRFIFKRPAAADAGHPLLNLAGRAVHILLYLGVFALLFSGASLSTAYSLPNILAGDGAMPADLFVYPQRFLHGILSNLMMALIALHAGAALYHQFIRKDNLLARMWFGKK
jgi:cytochrome b561